MNVQYDDLDVVVGVDHLPRLIIVAANLGSTEIKTWPDSPEVGGQESWSSPGSARNGLQVCVRDDRQHVFDGGAVSIAPLLG